MHALCGCSLRVRCGCTPLAHWGCGAQVGPHAQPLLVGPSMIFLELWCAACTVQTSKTCRRRAGVRCMHCPDFKDMSPPAGVCCMHCPDFKGLSPPAVVWCMHCPDFKDLSPPAGVHCMHCPDFKDLSPSAGVEGTLWLQPERALCLELR